MADTDATDQTAAPEGAAPATDAGDAAAAPPDHAAELAGLRGQLDKAQEARDSLEREARAGAFRSSDAEFQLWGERVLAAAPDALADPEGHAAYMRDMFSRAVRSASEATSANISNQIVADDLLAFAQREGVVLDRRDKRLDYGRPTMTGAERHAAWQASLKRIADEVHGRSSGSPEDIQKQIKDGIAAGVKEAMLASGAATFDGGTAAGGARRTQFSRAEIKNMNREEYERSRDDILAASAAGRIR